MVQYDTEGNMNNKKPKEKLVEIPCEQVMIEPLQHQHCHRVHLCFGQLHIAKFESLIVV